MSKSINSLSHINSSVRTEKEKRISRNTDMEDTSLEYDRIFDIIVEPIYFYKGIRLHLFYSYMILIDRGDV
jgi:hypothetical protein